MLAAMKGKISGKGVVRTREGEVKQEKKEKKEKPINGSKKK